MIGCAVESLDGGRVSQNDMRDGETKHFFVVEEALYLRRSGAVACVGLHGSGVACDGIHDRVC